MWLELKVLTDISIMILISIYSEKYFGFKGLTTRKWGNILFVIIK